MRQMGWFQVERLARWLDHEHVRTKKNAEQSRQFMESKVLGCSHEHFVRWGP
jgi:hypothetical protein